MKVLTKKSFLFCLLFFAATGGFSKDEAYKFYPRGIYEPGIPTPQEILGFEPGNQPATNSQIVTYFQLLAKSSDRAQLFKSGMTHEGRPLYYLIVSTEENMAQLDKIKKNVAKLADPRLVSPSKEANELISSSPIIAWMMYSIHGNELSGADASLQLAYQLVAGIDSITVKIREHAIVGIDPNENPDGRARTLAQLQQWSGAVATSDVQSIYHQGMWPGGRTNHYLFDLNRDWFLLTQPETRARVKAITGWNPQLVVDAHEMGSYDTYLFNPPREPINPFVHPNIKKWWAIFAKDQAKAFDQYGWSYYTREWLEEWYPGYGSSWPYYHGAIAILYEQARTAGTKVKRPEGIFLSFQEAVHHQFTSSMANIRTAVDNREAILRDFYAFKQEAISAKNSSVKAYIIEPGNNPSRAFALVNVLQQQGIEVRVATENFKLKQSHDFWGNTYSSKIIHKDAYIIDLAQPAGRLAHTILDFDTRMTTDFLKTEREYLEKGKGTRMYEVSAWSLPLAYNVSIYEVNEKLAVKSRPIEVSPTSPGILINPTPDYGFAINNADDCILEVLLNLFELGYKVRCAEEPFKIDGYQFKRGSLLLRKQENPNSLSDNLEKIAAAAGIMIYGLNSALSTEGPDLGARKFHLLEMPKIAILAGEGISTNSFGSLWFLLDKKIGLKHTILNHANFSRTDLRKYNVLVLPSTWGGMERYNAILNKKELQKIKTWVGHGGTLIAIGNAAAFMADSSSGISRVQLRRQALAQLDIYKQAAKEEQQAGKTRVDSVFIWDWSEPLSTTEMTSTPEKPKDISALKQRDERQRLFSLRGAILNVRLNDEHWLSFGEGKSVPAPLYTSYAFLSKKPAQTIGRFADAANIRLSGLVWPEARQRWAESAYVTREAFGNGQMILFAGEPFFRAYFHGTARLFLNAVLLGPGLGTHVSVDF